MKVFTTYPKHCLHCLLLAVCLALFVVKLPTLFKKNMANSQTPLYYSSAPDQKSAYDTGKPPSYDVESGGDSSGAYIQVMEGAVRQGFIRKVYSLLTCMLFVTFSTVALFSLVDSVRAFIQATPSIMGVSLGAYIISAIALTCCGDSVRRKYPTNYILLGLFTAATSVMVGVIASTYAPDTVALAAGLTFSIFLGLTAFAIQTKIDFTPFNQGCCTLLWGLILFGLSCAFFPGQAARNLYAALGAILFSFFIVIDTQLLIGGGREISVGVDDYVMVALQLYLDVVNLFLKLLQLVSWLFLPTSFFMCPFFTHSHTTRTHTNTTLKDCWARSAKGGKLRRNFVQETGKGKN